MPLQFQPKLLLSGRTDLSAYIEKQQELAMSWEDSAHVKAITSRMIKEQSCSLTQRLISILDVQKHALANITEPAACVVLLPEIDTSQDIAAVISALKQVFTPMQGPDSHLDHPPDTQ